MHMKVCMYICVCVVNFNTTHRHATCKTGKRANVNTLKATAVATHVTVNNKMSDKRIYKHTHCGHVSATVLSYMHAFMCI